MEKINFVNNSTPALNETNLNKLQDNVEDSIQEVVDKIKTTTTNSDTDTYSCNYINGIIESGSNSNGNYTKYADGTLICYGIKDLQSSSWGDWGTWKSQNFANAITFPQTFYSIIMALVQNNGSTSFNVHQVSFDTSGITNIGLNRPTDVGGTLTVGWFAIGKWK